MKKASFCIIMLLIVGVLFTGCEMQFGTKYVNDPQKYGEWESYIDVPSFLPQSIDEYQVNSYSYTLYAYMDICYEIFVDLSVSEEQLEQLVANAKSHADYLIEKEAYYADGYIEIVFEDNYDIDDDASYTTKQVGWADIEKVLYNPETLNIIYVCFHANDTSVYELDDVKYFDRFSIQEGEYVSHIIPEK